MKHTELRKIINKKAKIKCIDDDYFGEIEVDGVLYNIPVDLDYLSNSDLGIEPKINEVTVNDVWDCTDLIKIPEDMPQEIFSKMKIENVITLIR